MINTSALIPVVYQVIDHHSVQTVDARTLHEFLEVGRDFSNWIKDRIDTYGFVEGQDFCSLISASKDSEGRGGHNRKDYALTLDMAKELAMVERTPKGKQARLAVNAKIG
jgi:phage anti-repressor protein